MTRKYIRRRGNCGLGYQRAWERAALAADSRALGQTCSSEINHGTGQAVIKLSKARVPVNFVVGWAKDMFLEAQVREIFISIS